MFSLNDSNSDNADSNKSNTPKYGEGSITPPRNLAGPGPGYALAPNLALINFERIKEGRGARLTFRKFGRQEYAPVIALIDTQIDGFPDMKFKTITFKKGDAKPELLRHLRLIPVYYPDLIIEFFSGIGVRQGDLKQFWLDYKRSELLDDPVGDFDKLSVKSGEEIINDLYNGVKTDHLRFYLYGFHNPEHEEGPNVITEVRARQGTECDQFLPPQVDNYTFADGALIAFDMHTGTWTVFCFLREEQTLNTDERGDPIINEKDKDRLNKIRRIRRRNALRVRNEAEEVSPERNDSQERDETEKVVRRGNALRIEEKPEEIAREEMVRRDEPDETEEVVRKRRRSGSDTSSTSSDSYYYEQNQNHPPLNFPPEPRGRGFRERLVKGTTGIVFVVLAALLIRQFLSLDFFDVKSFTKHLF